ncbi:MAG: autotransporter adhesin family protein, partial [Lachnospiraceae bacterium]|nr:autotransporter adhesin family protein [Lachnospiraceae bacterium]
MTKRKSKHLLSLLLLAVMVAAFTAVLVFTGREGADVYAGEAVAQIDETTYETLADAFSAAEDGDTITLLQSTTVTESSKSDNGLYQVNGINVTLNLNEYTLTVTNKRAFGVLGGGSLTVQNGTIAYAASGDTTLVITRAASSFSASDVTFSKIEDSSETTSSLYLVYAAAGGSVTLENCTIGNVSNAVVKDYASATVYMKGCDFDDDVTAVSGSNTSKYEIYIDIDSTNSISEDVVKVEGGYIYTVKENGSIAAGSTLYVKDDGKLILDGGTLSGSIVIRDGGELDVDDGTVSDDITVEAGGKLYVSGGTVSGTITNAGYTSISGGTVSTIKLQTNTSSEVAAADDDEPDYTVAVSGGTVSGNITVASGTVLNLSGGTVNGTITTAGTFNMTGGTVSVKDLNSDNGAIHVTGGTITISGGTVTAEGTKARAISTASNSSITSSTISGGTFTGSNLALLVQTGTTGLSVTGGTFVTTSSGLASIIDRAGAVTVSVYDATGSTVSKDSSNYYKSSAGDYTVIVASSCPYEAKITSGTATTAYETFDEAIAAATTDGDTITLLNDATWTLTASKTIKIGLTFDLNGHTLTLSGNYYINFQPASSSSTVAFIDSSYVSGDLTGKVIGSYGSTSYGMIRITKACTIDLENVYFENQSYGYVMEFGTTSGVIISLDASNCEFVNTNTTTYSSSTTNYLYSYGVKLYGNSASADPDSNKLVFENCKFTTAATNSGYTLNILNGKSGTNSVIEITGCTIVSNGSATSWDSSYGTITTSPAALVFGTSFYSKVTVTASTITANSAKAISANYNVNSDADITFGDGNIVTGLVSLGNGTTNGASSYTIKVTGGFFDNGESVPFVVSSESGTSLTTLVSVTGGYYKTDVSDVVAGGYSCVADSTYDGYNYTVSQDDGIENMVAFTVSSEGAKTYYSSLYDAVSAADDTATAVCFFVDCELTGEAAQLVASSGKTICNYGNVTLTYNGTLSALVTDLRKSSGSGSVSVVSLVYNYDDSTTHSISGAVLTGSGLTSGGVTNMKMTDETNWTYYATDDILADGYVYHYSTTSTPNYTVVEASSSTAEAKIGNYLYVNVLSSAIPLASNKSYVDCAVTLLKDVTRNVTLGTANYTVVLDLGGYTMTGYIYIQANNVNLTVKNGTVTVDNSSGFAIYTNGSYTGETLTLDNVTVTNTTGYAMYLAADGETTITDCSITGVQAGIEVRAGSLTVTDSTVTSTIEDFGTQNNNSGTTVYGAGIAVSQHTTNKEINVTITDSVISGYYGIYEINYNSSNTNTVNISISGESTKVTGNAAEAIYSVSVSGTEDESISATTNSITTVSISGGYFTSDPSVYVAAGYQATAGTYTFDDDSYSYLVEAKSTTLGISNSADIVIADEIIGEGESVMYALVSSDNISKYYSTEAYPTTSLTFTDEDGAEHTYIFAGWYSYDGSAYNALTSFPGSDAYAKFVDADILSVKCFFTPSTSIGNVWRFITSWDSLYSNEGFVVYSDSECQNQISQ